MLVRRLFEVAVVLLVLMKVKIGDTELVKKEEVVVVVKISVTAVKISVVPAVVVVSDVVRLVWKADVVDVVKDDVEFVVV